MTRSNRSLETLSGIAGILLAALDARGQSGLDASGSRPFILRDGSVHVVEIPGEAVSPDEPTRLDKGFADERFPTGLSPDPYALGFAAGAFRPPRGTKLDPRMAVRQSARSGDAAAEDVTFGYVMFEGRITGERKAEVSALGVDLLFYHPNNCFAARIPVGAIHALSLLPSVHWVGYARPEQKIHPNLLRGIEEGWLHGAIPVWVNLFQSDLGPRSRRIPGRPPVVTSPDGTVREGDPADGTWAWETHGAVAAVIERCGAAIIGYREEIRAYEAIADTASIMALIERDEIAFVEWRTPMHGFHDRLVPVMGHDYVRESIPASTVTVGVVDSGFHLANGGYNGHLDLDKQAVGWDLWPGACGSVFCDEPSTSYHGTSMLGTICGTGTVNNALRGTSPWLGELGADHRLFLVKGYTTAAFVHMRSAYTDPWGSTTPRPVIVSNSWGFDGCLSGCTVAANWIGSEADARVADDEVFTQNQLYIFAAGNEGGLGGQPSVPGTIGIPAVAKNVLTVGMTRSGRNLTTGEEAGSLVDWGSAGPCGDGRWKPNVSAPGCLITSTLGGTTSGYAGGCGTSASTAAAAGALSSVAEIYGDFRNSAPLARAWAMATAVTWQDTSSIWVGGPLPSNHLNTLGMGRISSLKAHWGGGTNPWYRNWASDSLASETDTFDLTVSPGASRLVVVLTWDDPQAAPGANPARVSDIDLFLDLEPWSPQGNVAEYWSNSALQTVEHIVLDNPPPGNYRVKVYPYWNPQPVRWGAMAVQILGDTTPGGTLTSSVSASFVRPNDTVTVSVAASSDATLATNVFLGQDAHDGMTLLGTETTLKDGQVLTNRHTPEGHYTFGDIIAGDYRSMSYTYGAGPGDAVRTIHHQARSDNSGIRFTQATIVVDGTPPPNPWGLHSTTHPLGGWSNSRTLGFAWSQAPDNLSGLAGYCDGRSGSLPVGVPAVLVLPPVTTSTMTVGADYTTLWYGLRAVDQSGNWTSEVVAGPYGIDTVLPLPPSNLASTSHTPWGWSNDPAVAFSFSPAWDDRSGIAGYGTAVAEAPSDPPHTVVLPSTATGTTLTLPTSPYGRYLSVNSVDQAGNWSAAYAVTGPYFVDTVPPEGVSLVINGGAAETGSADVTLSIAAADGASGLQMMRFRNDLGAFSPWEPFATLRAWNLGASGGSTALGTQTVVIEVRDVAGNVASAQDSIYRYAPVTYHGTACQGWLGLPVIAVSGIPGVGRAMTIAVQNTAAPTAVLYAGVSDTAWAGYALPLNLGSFGLPGCVLGVSLDLMVWNGPPVALPIAIPTSPGWAGLTVYLQWILIGDPLGTPAVLTRWAEVTIAGP